MVELGFLAVGTDVSAAAGDADFGDGGGAAGTRVVGFSVDLGEEVEIVTGGAVGFAVVAEGGATGVKGGGHGATDAGEDLGGFVWGNRGNEAGGVDFCVEEGFVGVDIPYPGDDGLVEKGGFYRGFGAFLELFIELAGCEMVSEGFWAERCEKFVDLEVGSGEEFDEAEFALVVKEEVGVVGEGDLDAGVAVGEMIEEAVGGVAGGETGRFSRGGDENKLAGHAEVDEEAEVGVEIDEEGFATAMEGFDGEIEGASRVADEAFWVLGGDFFDCFADEKSVEATTDCFDFWEFGHDLLLINRRIVARRRRVVR